MRKLKEDEKRKEPLYILLTKKEKEQLIKEAEKENTILTYYVRKKLFEKGK